MISKKELINKIKEYHSGDISNDCIVELQSRCSMAVDYVIKEAVEEFNKNNRIREAAGVKTLRRLKLYKQFDDLEMGNTGQDNEETVLSEVGAEFQ